MSKLAVCNLSRNKKKRLQRNERQRKNQNISLKYEIIKIVFEKKNAFLNIYS